MAYFEKRTLALKNPGKKIENSDLLLENEYSCIRNAETKKTGLSIKA